MKNNEMILKALNNVKDELIPWDNINKADKNTGNIEEYYAEMEIVSPKKLSVRKRAIFGGGCAAVLAVALALNGIYNSTSDGNAYRSEVSGSGIAASFSGTQAIDKIHADKHINNKPSDLRIYPENKWEKKTDELPLIPSTFWCYKGFEGPLLASGTFDIENPYNYACGENPWTEDTPIDTLPVFRNLCYTYEGTKVGFPVPSHYTEEQLREMCEKIIYILDLTVKESNISYEGLNGTPYCLFSNCESDKYGNDILICIYANGEISINLTGADSYPQSEFEKLFQYEDPVYTWDEKENCLHVHEKCDNITEKMLCCFLSNATVSGNTVSVTNMLAASEYIGDYPIITPRQAIEQFRNGDYITAVPEKYIISNTEVLQIELIYETSNADKYLQPYYCIVAVIDNGSSDTSNTNPYGYFSVPYGYFYVPAIAPEYRKAEDELSAEKTVLPTLTWETKKGDLRALKLKEPLLTDNPVGKTDTLGVSGTIYAENIEDLDNLNPWSEELNIEAMPVFRDLSYTEEWSFYCLSETQMREAADRAAHKLIADAEVTDTVFDVHSALDGGITNLTAVLRLDGYGVQNGVLRIYTTGKIELLFGDKAVEAAADAGLTIKSDYFTLYGSEYDEYKNFTLSAKRSTKPEASDAIECILEAFAAVFDYKTPTADPYPICTDTKKGAIWRHGAFDKSEDIIKSIVNYNLNYIVLNPTDNLKDKLISIEGYNHLAVSEYVGDYNIISAEEARQRLTEGDYFTNISEDKLSKCRLDTAAKTELVYLTELDLGKPTYNTFMEIETMMYVPYYRILVETDNDGEYGVFFVRAIR